ncbi:DinB family protein [Actinocorallia sp. A-T 12471]|uniref:DinB family protein n=1 Tax=Actinocorallia sp. A-T 12471 TaxID=3089813 RepID=UPI0029CCEB74|nr:DinB family protein [Actinocorallia sp. A-T 12471]MDX6744800.1 DinB family protein [Actinocorallia sp. A-T 12471]
MNTERADFLAALDQHRTFLRFAVQGVTDAQARARPTVSELSLGGLVKHVAATEHGWMRFAVFGPGASPEDPAGRALEFTMGENETLQSLLDSYAKVAEETNALIAELDLDTAQPLPEAPWFEPGATWTVRRVLLHIIAETAQHAGHADILRETIDGQKTMG